MSGEELAPQEQGSESARARILAIDWMRGFVIVLMAIDHASEAFNANQLATDSFFMYEPGTPLALGQFLTRWISHLCAPAFVFLAGTALALSSERRVAKGEDPRQIDKHIAIRGALLIVFEIAWMSWIFTAGSAVLLQVLYAIGASFLLMPFLRRLTSARLWGIAVFLILASELLIGMSIQAFGFEFLPTQLLLSGGSAYPHLLVLYPCLPWLAIMILGWIAGRYLLEKGATAKIAGQFLKLGVGLLVGFAVVRGANGYGNMNLYREGHDLVQWLHVSKYPPSISFICLELGIMAVCLSLLWRLQGSALATKLLSPLLVLGQTALFFYLLHVHILVPSAMALGFHKKQGLVATYVAAAAVVLFLLPVCYAYRAYKARHKESWLRYV